MPEPMESSRRWSGYVCPDCRFVFRVPRDHDGQGVVCPSCRRMLKIPTASDQPPPLVAALRVTPAEERAISPQESRRSSRRSKKTRHRDVLKWDSSAGKPRRVLALHVERRQMLWMLLGGTALFALILAGVLLASHSKDVAVPQGAGIAAGPGKPAAARSAPAERSDAVLLAAVEPLTKKFLAATRIEDLLPLVRHPEVAEARMRKYYANGVIDPPGLAEFNIDFTVQHRGAIFTVKVRTCNFEEKPIAYVDTKQGLRIDWESWVGWSAMTWNEFLTTKPTTARIFRVGLKPLAYYNFAFADDKKWQAYGIIPPNGGQLLYGYAARGSDVSAKLPQVTDTQQDVRQEALILALKFPAQATAANQVLIEDLVADGWVLETEPPP